jgi:TetR/AcrR family transcriptional repressor of nem operon
MGRTSAAREDLIESAAHELWQGSYGSVGVGALCSAAGVKRGSFYYFFESKDDLVLAALEHHWQQLRGPLEGMLGDEGKQPLERLRTFFDTIADLHEQERQNSGQVPGCPFGNLSVELATHNEAVRERVAEIFGRIQARFATWLRAARDAGVIDLDDSQVADRAEQLFGCMQGAQVLAKTYTDPGVIRRMAPAALAIATAP